MSSHNNQNINGWVILDKPQAMSSNQALRHIQYLLRAKKAGHIGTLDPFATGVLPLAFGEATKLIPYFEDGTKKYIFTLKFGSSTTTGDTEGEPCSTSKKIPSLPEIKNALPNFTGKIMQIPPKFSAIHINGRRAYELARNNENFTIPPREVEIKTLTLIEHNPQTAEAVIEVECSKGTYIRTLGEDIATHLGSCGHLTALRRTKSGFFDLTHTISLDNLKNMLYKKSGDTLVLPVETFLCDITVIALTQDQALKLKSGQALDSKAFKPFKSIGAACCENKLVALVGNKENKIFPIRVFNQ